MHTSGILKTEQSFPNKVIYKVLNFTIKALFAWENNDCWEGLLCNKYNSKRSNI